MKEKPHRPARPHPEPPRELTAHQLWWRLGGRAVAALVVAVLLVFVLNRPHVLTGEERGVLRAYEEIRAALAGDDLGLAKVAAGKMAEAFRDRAPSAAPARKLAASVTLREARLAFKDLSTDALRLARGQAGYHVARCPGEQCTEKCDGCPMHEFSPCVQTNTTVENPFMGRAHLRCGVINQ